MITADFVSEFPETQRGHNSVLVVVEKLSKRAIFIPTKKSITTPDVIRLFVDYVFSKHGIPSKIILDRDKLFKSKYFRGFNEILNVKLNIASKDHPQTDGQSENMIRILIQMLRNCVQKDSKNWDTMLSELEFAYNSSKNKSTGLTPFEVDLGRIPQSELSRELDTCTIQCQAAASDVDRRRAFRQFARDNLSNAASAQKFYANKSRIDKTFKENDLVMLKVQGTGVATRSDLPQKCQPKFMGPFKVLKVMGPVTYKIELPPSMSKAHNVFHVSKLKKFVRGPADQGSLSVVIDPEGNVEQEVIAILNKKRVKRRIFYLVQFEGDEVEDSIWMPSSDLRNCRELIKKFETSPRTSTSKKG